MESTEDLPDAVADTAQRTAIITHRILMALIANVLEIITNEKVQGCLIG